MGSNNSKQNSTPQPQYTPTPPTTVYVTPIPPRPPTGPAPAAYECSAADLYPPLDELGQQDDVSEGQTTASRNMMKEAVQCSVLLRQLFNLDFKIWGMGKCDEEEVAHREELKRNADALFTEIRWMVYELRSTADLLGSMEEKKQIREICRMLDEHESPRYVV